MSKTVKYIAVVLVAALAVALVTGVAYWTASHPDTGDAPGLYIDGKRIDPAPSLVSYDGTEVPFGVWRHYFLLDKAYSASEYSQYVSGDIYADDPDGYKMQKLKSDMEEILRPSYAWLKIAAEEGIELDEDDLAQIDETVAGQKEQYGDGFQDYLEDMFYTSEEDYRQVSEMQALVTKARTAYEDKLRDEVGDEVGKDADDEYAEGQLRVKHILIYPIEASETGEALDAAAAKQAAYDFALQLREQVLASEDPADTFDKLMHEHSEDPGLETNPDGYVFATDGTTADGGAMAEPFVDASNALKEGEVSQPVWNEQANYSGYHLIMRMPLSDEDLEGNRETAVSTRVSELSSEKVAELEAGMVVTYSDYYDKLTIDSIR